jgi:YD repeat-containing protein
VPEGIKAYYCVDDFLDYALPGPIPLEWKRFYDSSLADQDGPLGRGFRHNYQRELRQTPGGFEYVNAEGERVEFDALPPDKRQTSHDGILLSLGDDGVYRLAEAGAPTMEFRLDAGGKSAPLAALATRHHRVEFQYDSLGRLESMRGSQGEYIRVRYESTNHIRKFPSVGRINVLASSRRMNTTSGATWSGGPMRLETPPRMATTTRADDKKPTATATPTTIASAAWSLRTWGDDGMYGAVQYFPEALLTVRRMGMAGVHTSSMNSARLSKSPISRFDQVHDGRRRSVGRVDPAGNVTQFLYDPWGGHTRRVAPTGHILPPMHVQPQQPDVLAYELPRTPVEWEWGTLLAGQVSEQVNDGDPVLREFPLTVAAEDLGPIRNVSLLRSARVSDAAEGESFSQAAGTVGRPAATREGLPKETRDAMGQLVERTDAQGRCERWQYDRNGNLVAYHDPDGGIHGLDCILESHHQRVDPLGNVTTFDYSIRERITRSLIPVNGQRVSLHGCDRLVQVATRPAS